MALYSDTVRGQIASVLHHNEARDGRQISRQEREQLLNPYLPAPRESSKSSVPILRNPSSQLRQFIAALAHRIIFMLIQLVFTVYMRVRQGYHAIRHRVSAVLYYHHRTPELIRRDLKGLARLPNHLSVIAGLDVHAGGEGYAHALSRLVAEVAELVAWCTCAGIPTLSIYEKTGVLKGHIPALHSAIAHTLRAYYTSSDLPTYALRVPNQPSFSPPDFPSSNSGHSPIKIILLSEVDGRATLVDLTKTLVDMTQKGKIRSSEITMDLIDVEVTEGTCGEPDLLIVMAPSERKRVSRRARRKRSRLHQELEINGVLSTNDDDFVGRQPGGEVCLHGYPPWHLRLTEIYHAHDKSGIEYQVFLRGLYNYGRAQMRLGR